MWRREPRRSGGGDMKDKFIREVLTLVPFLSVQFGIYRAANNRYVTFVVAAMSFIAILSNSWMLGTRWRLLEDAGGITYVWMMACVPAYLIYLALRWMGAWAERDSADTGRRQLLTAAAKVAVASPFAVLAYGIGVGRLEFYVREVSLAVPGLHPDLEGLRILHLSDVHMSQFLSERDFARVVDMSNGLRANLAIMTGDLISKPGDPMEACVRQLARVKADAGMYGCLGNHEMYAKAEAAVKAEGAKYGIQFLRHEARQVRFGAATMNIGGVDYQKGSERPKYLAGAEKLIVPGALNVMLSHNPDVFPVSAKQGWGLTLAGHTHGGQITFEIVEQYANVARFLTPYVAGEYHLGNAGCYVTRGIGTIGVPARVGVPPEITLLRLRKA